MFLFFWYFSFLCRLKHLRTKRIHKTQLSFNGLTKETSILNPYFFWILVSELGVLGNI